MQEAISLVSYILEPIYRDNLRREQPVNLARVLVEKSFTPSDLKFGGQTIGAVGTVVHAAEALKAGYTYVDVGREAGSACAAGLGVLIRRALTTGTSKGLQVHDLEYLALMDEGLNTDRQWAEAVSGLPKAAPPG